MSTAAPSTLTLFSDRIVNVAVTGMLVRIDLGQLEPPEEAGGKPRLVATQRIVLPLDGFAASFGMLEAVMKKLVDDGLIQKRQEAPPTGAVQ